MPLKKEIFTMLNESLSIANMLKNNIKNSMINNIYSISLLSSGRNSNFNVTTKNKSFVPFIKSNENLLYYSLRILIIEKINCYH